ncbi:MAG: PKD domain-containing protein, partial [Parafilimonas sp.]
IADITHKWEFSDGKTDTAKDPAHTYSTAGTYNVKLIATNGGCTDSAFTSVRLINENGGSILLSDSVFCRGSKVFFNITGVNVSNIRNTTWDFGNGVTSTVSGTNTNYIYDTAGSFRITAVMTDLNGCTYTLQIPNSITVYGPLAAFYTKTPGICQNGTVDFTDNSTNDGIHSIKKWAWDYGDGTTQNYNGAPFSHTYNDTGVYIVKLSVTDTYGCTDSLKRIDYINVTHPYVSFSMPDSVVCPGKQVSFQNNSSGAQLQYTWNFGDGSQSNAPNPSYTYSTPGLYTPVLFATDKNGCADSFSLRPITVATPKAKFNMSDSASSCPPLTVNFTNKSSNYAVLLWNFGDGSTSNIDAPAHIYTYPGIYPAKLLVTGNGGCADSLIKNITIKGPTGNMTYTLTTCYPNKVVFVASALNTVKYTWDFGDGATIITSTDRAFHLYDTGRYLPKMILSDSIGCNVLIKGTDTLKVFDVKARATSSTNLICDSGSVTFTDASESNDIIKDHIWIFEDSTSLNQPVAAHSYTTSGSYTTQLVSITQFGCIDTLTITNAVIVSRSPAISIQGDTAACAGANVSFNGINTSDTSALNWSWNFGNGSTATTQNANTVYIKGGIYLINLIAANNNGCADSISSSIKINPPPAVYAGKDTTVCQSSPYIITASGASTYTWISGENIGCRDCASTQITPANSGNYTVQGKDAIGCSATDSVYIRVIKPSQISASGSDTVCVGQTVQLSAGGAQSYQWIPSVYLDNSNAATPVYTAAKDTSIIYNVIGYSEKKCFSDTTSVTIKSYPVPQMQIMDDKITLSAGNSVRLQTNNSPDITEWRWEPPQGLDNPTAASPLASPFQTTTYNCLAVNGGGCAARTQAVISVVCGGSNIFVPNTFSPNNDGMNDQFYARGTGLFAVKTFRIFNRWGQLVFEKLGTSANNAADGWNGMFNNLQATADVYIYMMEIVCQNNAVIPIKGNITLIR